MLGKVPAMISRLKQRNKGVRFKTFVPLEFEIQSAWLVGVGCFFCSVCLYIWLQDPLKSIHFKPVVMREGWLCSSSGSRKNWLQRSDGVVGRPLSRQTTNAAASTISIVASFNLSVDLKVWRICAQALRSSAVKVAT